VRILFRSEKEIDAQNEAEKFSKIVSDILKKLNLSSEETHTRLLGPASAPIKKIHNKYRFHVLLKTIKPDTLHDILEKIIPEYKKSMKESVNMEIEFDAVDLL
jgi:primosomal protein N'